MYTWIFHDIWTCVCSFQCSGIYSDLHSFFFHVEANGLTGYLSARLGSESAWTSFFGGQSNSSSSLGVVGYHWVIPISWKTPISTSVQGLVNVHIVVFQTSIRPTTWDQHVQELFCHNSRVISLTARSAVLSLSGSRLLCGPGVALGDAGSAAGKGPRAGQGCQLRKVAESKKWVDFTTFSQEILFVFFDM